MVRLVARNRAGNELASHPVSDPAGTGGWSAAAAALTSAGAIPGGVRADRYRYACPRAEPRARRARWTAPGPGHASRAGPSWPSRRARRPARVGRAQQRGHQMRSAPYDERAAYLADTRRIGAPGADRAGPRPGRSSGPASSAGAAQDRPGSDRAARQTGPVGPFEQTGPMPQVATARRVATGTSGPGRSTTPASTTSPRRTDRSRRPRVLVPVRRCSPPGPAHTARLRPRQYSPPASLSTAGLFRPDSSAPDQFQPGPPAQPARGSPRCRASRTSPALRAAARRLVWPDAADRSAGRSPRYAAGNYNDWSGPLERIDPEAPPLVRRAHAHPPSTAPVPVRRGRAVGGGSGQYERPRPAAAVRADRRDRPLGPVRAAPVWPPTTASPAGQPQYQPPAAVPVRCPRLRARHPGTARRRTAVRASPGSPCRARRRAVRPRTERPTADPSRPADAAPAQAQYRRLRAAQAQYPQAQYPQAQYQAAPYQPGPAASPPSTQPPAGYEPPGPARASTSAVPPASTSSLQARVRRSPAVRPVPARARVHPARPVRRQYGPGRTPTRTGAGRALRFFR